MFKNKTFFYNCIHGSLLFLFLFNFVFSLSNEEFLAKLPYNVNFTESELKLLKTLSATDLEKIIKIATLVKQQSLEKYKILNNKKLAEQARLNAQNNDNNLNDRSNPNNPNNPANAQQKPSLLDTLFGKQPTATSPFLTPQTPHYNPATGQFQNTPASNGGILGSLLGSTNSGLTQGLPPIDPNFKIPENIAPECRLNYGIDPGGSCPDVIHLTSKVKTTAMQACTLIKKKISSQSQYRDQPCNRRVGGASASSHMSGMALDINVNNLSSTERQTVFLTFKKNGFNNIGCYRKGSGNVHLDHRGGGPRRWGPSFTKDDYSPSNCPSELIQVFGN